MSVSFRDSRPASSRLKPFRHEALLYAGEEAFVNGCTAFVRGGLERGEPALVFVAKPRLDRLRESLGREGERVLFADMAAVGRNPARIIPSWQQFVAEHAGQGASLRGVGEPIYPEREADELIECQRHETLLDLAFTESDGFWLLCPYDTEALPGDVIEEARRSHPFLAEDQQHERSPEYRGPEARTAALADPLPDPPSDAAELRFGRGPLESLRRFVGEQAALGGLSRRRSLDLVVAANEIASNSLKYGGGSGVLRIWRERRKTVCEIRDAGRLDDPLADRRLPTPGGLGGRGLWLANQLCDLVQIRSLPAELVVRLHVVDGHY